MQSSHTTNHPLGFVFPGQGSQSVGMLAELANEFPQVIETYTEASAILGYDLWRLVQDGPEAALNQTEKTQPALLTASIAIWRIWQAKQGAMPALMAGHSLGEYSALVCAEALSFKDAVKLVADRGKYMQAAVPAGMGAMAAIAGLDDAAINKLCAEAAQGEIITAANFNSIGQTVVAGHTNAVQRAIAMAKTAGAKLAKLLPVSVPSHCPLMRDAAVLLARDLKQVEIKPPKIPVIHNADANLHGYHQPDAIRNALIKQLEQPVRWVETMQSFAAQGIKAVVECGPGKVLAGLNKRITTELQTYSINTPQQLIETLLVIQGLK